MGSFTDRAGRIAPVRRRLTRRAVRWATEQVSRLGMVRRVVVGKRKIGRVARDVGISRQTVRKWVRRYLEEGKAGLVDRSSRPHRSPGRCSPVVE